MGTVIRDSVDGQVRFDLTQTSLLAGAGNVRVLDRTYKNISGALESVAIGQVMGVVAATGMWVVCKSGATDGSKIPRGVIMNTLTAMAINQEVTSVQILVSGDIDSAQLVFNGTDTLATVLTINTGTTVTMGDELRANTQIQFRDTTDVSIKGN
jgi:hypothetical protein